jgi:protoheme IX farnesyltransferase
MNVRVDALQSTSPRARVADFVELTKPRITALVVLTTWVGYAVASGGDMQTGIVLHTLLGTALTCGGTSALNQVWERETDGRMRRTRERPLPTGRLQPLEGLLFGVGISLAGLLELALWVNVLAAGIAAATLLSYLFAYTPLKRRSWWSTTVGAFPGAAPPLIGWAAARGSLEAGALALFAIQFIWQLPHFYAIAWMYREDYGRAGFPMLSVIDADGKLTSRQIAAWTALLLPVSLLPFFLGDAGWLYASAAFLLGLVLLVLAVGVLKEHDANRARRVFLGSILYLPLLLGALVLDALLV